MKIIEAQSAVLTNFEVYTHLTQLKERYAREKVERKAREGVKYEPKKDTRMYSETLLLVLHACMSDSYANTA